MKKIIENIILVLGIYIILMVAGAIIAVICDVEWLLTFYDNVFNLFLTTLMNLVG